MGVKDIATKILITAEDKASGVFRSLQSNAAKVAAAVVGFFSFKAFSSAAESAEKLDVQMRKLDAVITATGGAAGLTAQEIDEMARRLDEATLGSAEGFRDAAAKLLTFKSVGKDAFETTLKLAQDLAATGFGTLETNIVQLGKALEDPISGMSSLRESGVTFTASQQEVIKSLVATGETAKAQGLILEAVAGQVAGVGAALGGGLSGAMDLVSKRLTDVKEQLGAAVLPVFTRFQLAVAELYKRLSDSGAITAFGQAVAGAFQAALDAGMRLVNGVDFDALIAKIAEWATSTRKAVADFAADMGKAADSAKLAVAVMSAGFSTIKAVVLGIAAVTSTMVSTILSGVAEISEGLAKVTFGGVADRFRAAAAELHEIAGGMGAVADAFGTEAKQALDQAAASADEAGAAYNRLAARADQATAANTRLAESFRAGERASQSNAAALNKVGATAQATAEDIKRLREEQQRAAEGGDLQRAVQIQEQIRQALQKTGTEAEKTGDKTAEANDKIKTAGEQVNNTFSTVSETTKKAGQDMADLGENTEEAGDKAAQAEAEFEKLLKKPGVIRASLTEPLLEGAAAASKYAGEANRLFEEVYGEHISKIRIASIRSWSDALNTSFALAERKARAYIATMEDLDRQEQDMNSSAARGVEDRKLRLLELEGTAKQVAEARKARDIAEVNRTIALTQLEIRRAKMNGDREEAARLEKEILLLKEQLLLIEKIHRAEQRRNEGKGGGGGSGGGRSGGGVSPSLPAGPTVNINLGVVNANEKATLESLGRNLAPVLGDLTRKGFR